MSPTQMTNFRMDADILDALRRIKERDGIPLSEQIRRAALLWIEQKGETVRKAERKQAGTRKRS